MFRKRREPVTETRKRRPSWGQPAPCPDCGVLGALLHVDPVDVVMHLRCRTCGAEWHLGEADVDNAPDAEQRARARGLKEEQEALRNARLAAATAEADWRYFRDQVAGGIEESR